MKYTLRPYQQDAVDAAIKTVGKGKPALIVAPTGAGKAQPLDEPVLTPLGWVKMGQLSVGDFVIGSDGTNKKITHIHPQGIKKVYKIITSDGGTTRCCGEHLWSVRTKYDKNEGKGFRTMSTLELKQNLLGKGNNVNKRFLPELKKIDFPEKNLPIHPYVLGALLGDGSFRHYISFTTNDIFVVDKVNSLLPPGEKLIKDNTTDYGYRLNTGHQHGFITKSIKSMGLWGKYSYEKSIPDIYMQGSFDQRLELLRGLMDTDGYGTSGRFGSEITTSSIVLAEQIKELVMSLGGLTNVKHRKNIFYTKDGERINARDGYRVNVNILFNPFSLPRKEVIYKVEKTQGRTRAIVSIEEDGFEECQCITIDSNDHLYITRDYILTHNSLIICGLLEKLHGHTIVFQPSKEILEQNYEKFVSFYGDSDVAIFSASAGQKEIARVTFATIGSVKNKPELFKHFDNILVDEAHGVSAEGGMYKDFIKMLGTRSIIGLTATPYRMHVSMAGAVIKILTRTNPRIFGEISYVIGMDYMVENGYLIKPQYFRVPGFDSSRLKSNSNGSEYSDASIREYFKDVKFDNSLLDVVKRLVNKGRKGILVFTYSVEDAHFIKEQLGDIACVITGTDKKKDREEKVKKFKSGEYVVALNRGCLTTGFDYPALDTIVIARPTKSVALYYQIVGRVLRQYPNKDGRVVDMCDNVDRMGQVEEYKLVDPGGNKWYLHNGKRMLTGVFI